MFTLDSYEIDTEKSGFDYPSEDTVENCDKVSQWLDDYGWV